MTKWTTAQQAAIESRGSNLLVAAAAGSGKTAVLVERIIRLITEDQVDIDKMLIVTFTNAAAGEMRERIARAITAELEKKNENEGHLRRQITLLNRSFITTIHSFCIQVVKKHFHFIDIDPAFRIGDMTEIGILQLEALEDLFEGEYERGEEGFHGVVESFGGSKEDTPLKDLVLKIYHFIQSQPDPEKWLREQVEAFNMEAQDFDKSIWIRTIKNSIEISIEGALELLREAWKICQKPKGPDGYLKAIENDMGQLQDLLKALKEGLNFFYGQLKSLTYQNIGRVGKDRNEGLKNEAKDLRDKAKAIIKDLQDDVFKMSPEEYMEDIQSSYPLMQYLYKLVIDFQKAYQEKKSERGIVDFNDLEHYTLRILENEMVSQEYREKFEYIFVDEYQDSNIVQETLIQRINRENNLFMVGDVKQSIYRFRLADPTLFIHKYESFATEEGDMDRRIDLSQNFRSREEILAGVNFLFQQIMSKKLGEIDYNERAALYPGGSFQPIEDLDIEVNIVEKNFVLEEHWEEEEGERIEEIEALEDIEVEAQIIAGRIKELLQQEIYDEKEKTCRKISYRDIVVLLRTTQSWAQSFLEVFTKEGIPTYADANTGYFEAVEISMFMNLLKVVDNKRQDLPLLSVMRSPMGGFKVEELIQIRVHAKEGSYYTAIEAYISNHEDALQEKLKVFIERLNGWCDEARHAKVDEFIWKLLMETGYYYYVGAMPGGIQRQANLRILLDRASQFEKTSIKGLFQFIKFVEKLESSKGDMGAAKILGENDNVVRIMSIHKSKGLEFPVVIVAGMGKNFNLRDMNADVLLHKELGIGPKFVDHERRAYRDTIAKLAMKDQIKMESLSEEMRILYVALTRPKDKLIMVGSLRNLDKMAKKWSKKTSHYSLMAARNYLDWIGSVLIKHPDGDALRNIGEVDYEEDQLLQDTSKWNIRLLGRRDIVLEEVNREREREAYRRELIDFVREEFTSQKEEIHRRLNWKYGHHQASIIPSKLSVSDIKKAHISENNYMGYKIPTLVRTPKFLQGKKEFTAAEKGTILHFVMQHIDLKYVDTLGEIEEQIQQMIVRELMTEEEAEIIDRNKIQVFFKHPLGKRLREAKKIWRETPFNIRKKAKDVIQGLDGHCDENLLVQGVIDCYFEEEECIVLVDYKSDLLLPGQAQNIVQKYSVQLDLYREALEVITGKKVKESYIYLFHIDDAIQY